MLCVTSHAKPLKRVVALLWLLAYLFLGIISPESASAFLVSMNGSHQVSVSSDASGQSTIVLHHHALQKEHSDKVFHQRNRQVEPDHVFLFQRKADQAGDNDLQDLKLALGALLLSLAGLFSFSAQLRTVQTQLAQPPPFRPLFSKIRQVTVLNL